MTLHEIYLNKPLGTREIDITWKHNGSYYKYTYPNDRDGFESESHPISREEFESCDATARASFIESYADPYSVEGTMMLGGKRVFVRFVDAYSTITLMPLEDAKLPASFTGGKT